MTSETFCVTTRELSPPETDLWVPGFFLFSVNSHSASPVTHATLCRHTVTPFYLTTLWRKLGVNRLQIKAILVFLLNLTCHRSHLLYTSYFSTFLRLIFCVPGFLSHFPFFASLSLFSVTINISLDPMVTRRADSLCLIQGLLSSNPLFQPSKCQVVSPGLCFLNFPVLTSKFVGLQPMVKRTDSLTWTCFLFSYFLTLVGIDYPLKGLKSFTQLSLRIALLGLPISSGVFSRKSLRLPPASCGGRGVGRGGLVLSLIPGPRPAVWFIHQLQCCAGFFLFLDWTEEDYGTSRSTWRC